MTIEVQCSCGRLLKAPDEFAGKRGECIYCGRILTCPSEPPGKAAAPAAAPAREEPAQITEFLDPPSAPIEKKKRSISLARMFEALLDPRSIQWMLILGGGLIVLGVVIWLVAWGFFENAKVLAAALGLGTLAILGTGWALVLKTRFKVAGQAVTFLGCILAPLNLWFYHAQELVTLQEHLWVGGVVCCLLYAATVYVLRDPLFMYAVEVGITLTVGLLLAELDWIGNTPHLCMFLIALGLISIHAERAFSPTEGHFTRERFGMPLFWSGHAQLGVSLLILLAVQIAGWLLDPIRDAFGTEWDGNLLTHSSLLAGALWLVGTYAYLYCDVVVRRVGIYTFVAAFCFLMTEITWVGTNLQGEGLIAILALTAMGAIAVESYVARANERLSRVVPPLAMALSVVPVLIGTGLHIRATSPLAIEMGKEHGWDYDTGWGFVLVMLLVAACNRAAAYLYRRTAPKWSAAYFFLSAAGLVVAAAGLLRIWGLEDWARQAPILMLIPLAYLIASRLWRGHTPERPLHWVAQTTTAVILVHIVAASQETFRSLAHPVQGQTENLLLGLVFAEAAVFYTLATIFRRRSANAYLATLAACGALWQLLGYFDVPGPYHTMMYAALGVGFLAIARALGVEQVAVYRRTGEQVMAARGKGLPALKTGNAILSVALLAAFLQGLIRLAPSNEFAQSTLAPLFALVLTAIASAAAICLVPSSAWRRLYATTTIALVGVIFLTLNVLLDLSGWQKLEIFCVAVGTLMIGISYVGRFREEDKGEDEMVTLGLWLGSFLAAIPLLTAVIYYRFPAAGLSLVNEIALLSVTVLMLLTGYSWQIKSTALVGGTTFSLYLVILVGSLGWQNREQEWVVGVFLAGIGALIFVSGIALSVYREKLLELPERIAKREGVFRMMTWR